MARQSSSRSNVTFILTYGFTFSFYLSKLFVVNQEAEERAWDVERQEEKFDLGNQIKRASAHTPVVTFEETESSQSRGFIRHFIGTAWRDFYPTTLSCLPISQRFEKRERERARKVKKKNEIK